MSLPRFLQKSASTLVLTLGLFTLSLVRPAQPIYATGVTLAPIRSILNTVAGQKLDVQFTIINEDDLARKFEIIPAQALGEDIVTDPKISKVEWLTTSHQELELAANGSQLIDVVINVPEDANSGSYKLLIIAREIAPNQASGVGTGINLAVAYPIEVNVIKELPQGNLQAFISVTPSFSLEKTFTANIDVQNVGNISLYPIMYLKVFNPNGDVVFQETINSEQRVLLAKNSHKQKFEFTTQSGNILTDLGEFTAELIALDSQLQISAKSTHKFIYIPAILAVTIIAAAIFGLWVLVKLAKQLRKRR